MAFANESPLSGDLHRTNADHWWTMLCQGSMTDFMTRSYAFNEVLFQTQLRFADIPQFRMRYGRRSQQRSLRLINCGLAAGFAVLFRYGGILARRSRQNH